MAWNDIPQDIPQMRRDGLFGVFSPAAPVDRQEVFAGRKEQLAALREVVQQRGQHAVIYGERGVGKTSLAKVSREIADLEEMFTAHVTCDSTDSFDAIWRKVLGEIQMLFDGNGTSATAAILIPGADPLAPNAVRVILRELAQSAPVVVFIDEFDVIEDSTARRQMAETIKVLSDQGVSATVVLIGVAENVTTLIAQHASTERNIVQVQMPRMVMDERTDIIRRGLKQVEMQIEERAEQRIALLSQGLPQFVHLLAQRSAIIAVDQGRADVTVEDVKMAIEIAITDTHESVAASYYEGVRSSRKVTLYPAILLACALVQPDDRGYFTASAIIEPLAKVSGTHYQISAFSQHLDRLATTRGEVLLKTGEKRRFRYRFRSPLMAPYILMKGIRDRKIGFEDVEPAIAPARSA